jgi:tRNA threonylcarbamoyl adenosine modification protein YjeE
VPTSDHASALTVDLPDEAATAALAEDLAVCLAPGDIVALSGGLGAGKTTFARALLRSLSGDPALEVPSPTFTLVQTYATGRLPVAHFDLYRLSGAAELDEIGFADAVREGAVLVEWPERASARLPPETVWLVFEVAGGGRRVTVSGEAALVARIARSRAVRSLLDSAGWKGARRRSILGDASNRSFQRIEDRGRRAVLMDWPPGSQLPAGDPRAPFRARDVRAFIAVDDALWAVGLSAPEILAADVNAGLLLMEDLGREGVVVDGAPDPERYKVAIELLAAIHTEQRPIELPLGDGTTHRLPLLGHDALLAEVGNFVDWYVPLITGSPLAAEATTELRAIWADLARMLANAEQSWVLFDFQSVNLFWLPERVGPARIGLIDFQDMFIGPSAYDVASICQDGRVTIAAGLERALRDRYVSLRLAVDPAFDRAMFAGAYVICGTSRTIKNMGAFARLASVGKQHYLNHLPRLREYLHRSLADPVLSDLALWYERYLTPDNRTAP